MAAQDDANRGAATTPAPKPANQNIEWVEDPYLRTANPPKATQAQANQPVQPERTVEEPKENETTQAAPPRTIEQQATANATEKTASVDNATRDDLSRQDLLRLLHERIRESDDEGLAKALSYAGLALADPDMQLRDNDIAHLTPSQQQVVREFHALLSALGRQITNGQNVDRNQAIQRLNAIVGDKTMSIRAVKLCERVRDLGVSEE